MVVYAPRVARKVLLAAGVLVAAAAGVPFFLAARVTVGVRLLVHVEAPETWDRTAEDVEHDTLAPMEAALVRAPGVAHVDGLAERGGATVEVSFVPGVSSRDARAAVDGALPASRAARTVALPARAPPLHVVLVGDVYPGADVRSAFARVLRPRLAAVAGVAEITICGGGGVPRVLVEVNCYQARGRGIDAVRIVSALQGALTTATTAQDLAAATIADQNGSPLRVRDVADVSASSGAPPCDAWRGSTRPSWASSR